MAIRRRVVSLWTHTRFVPTRVYRLMILAWLISGVPQLIYGAPNSVRETSEPTGWFDWAFVAAQLTAAVLVIVGLYFVEENTKPFVSEEEAERYNRLLGISLTIELVGVIGIQTIIAIQVAASTAYQHRVPSAGTTWMGILFALYLLIRVRDIVKAQRMLTQ